MKVYLIHDTNILTYLGSAKTNGASYIHKNKQYYWYAMSEDLKIGIVRFWEYV